MNGKSAYSIVPPTPQPRAVQDEWGMFDPNQAGLQAAFRAVRALDTPVSEETTPQAAGPDVDIDLTVLDTPDTEAVPEAKPVHEAATEPVPAAPRAVSRRAADDNVYDLTESSRRRRKPVERGAVYTLEFATHCPQCCSEITTVRVSRLLRTQVSFTSTLPRKGYIIVCPECDGILSAELSGLI